MSWTEEGLGSVRGRSCSWTQTAVLNTNAIYLKLDAVCARSRAHGCAQSQQQQAIPTQSHGHSHSHSHSHRYSHSHSHPVVEPPPRDMESYSDGIYSDLAGAHVP